MSRTNDAVCGLTMPRCLRDAYGSLPRPACLLIGYVRRLTSLYLDLSRLDES